MEEPMLYNPTTDTISISDEITLDNQIVSKRPTRLDIFKHITTNSGKMHFELPKKESKILSKCIDALATLWEAEMFIKKQDQYIKSLTNKIQEYDKDFEDLWEMYEDKVIRGKNNA